MRPYKRSGGLCAGVGALFLANAGSFLYLSELLYNTVIAFIIQTIEEQSIQHTKHWGNISMARRRRNTTDDIVKGIAAILLLGYGALANFWKSLTPEYQTLFLILSISALIVGAIFIVVFIRYKKQQQKIAWERAMKALGGTQNGGRNGKHSKVRTISPMALEKLAAQTYRQMGYQVVHTGQIGDHGVDVHLTNPDGQTELVQCKQWNHPVGEREVRDLVGAMADEKAARGIIWAPGGFSSPAFRWARGKPITLADEKGIDRLIEAAFTASRK